MWGGWRQHFGPDWVMKAGVLRLQFPGDYVPQKQPTDEPNTTELYAFIAWRAYSLRWDWSYTNAFATPDSKGSWYWTPPVPRPCRRASRRSSTSAASTRPAAVP
jgi:hypothetical protein